MTSSTSSGLGDTPTEIGLPTEAGATEQPARKARLAAGDIVGRYVILSRLGAGGMGVVYAAHDPELDRKLALKLLRAGFGDNPVARARLLREAQALARLSHPNVVTVHDVGTYRDRVWIAMEYVEGMTLTEWLAGNAEGRAPEPARGRVDPHPGRRRPAEIVDVIVQAGRGVAAAHAAGLLHRDLKPDNIMVGPSGRVWVMDFGLVRSQLGPSDDAELGAALSGVSSSISRTSNLTEVGALIGTPSYMAPEQFLDAPVDARTDEFSLCVTLWEALYGERPFEGEHVYELSMAITQGVRRPPPRGARVPGWLRRVCERGLAVDPNARFPSVAVLVAALERGRTRARWWVGAAVGLVVATGTAGALAWQQHREQQRIAACEAEGASIEEVWGEAARAKLRAALLATDVQAGAETVERVMPWLERYAGDWRDVRVAACTEAIVRETWSEDTLERSRWCLDDRRSQLEALVARLSTGDGRALVQAVPAASSLPSVTPCGDQTVLERLPFPPTQQREHVEAIRRTLAESSAEGSTGSYDRGLELADTAAARAEELGWPPLVAAARSTRGTLLLGAGHYAAAALALEAAYFEASKSGAVELAADTSIWLTSVVGVQLARPADGRHWSRLAELARLDLGHDDALREASYLVGLANVQTFEGKHTEAEASLQRALALKVEMLGPEHPLIDDELNSLAVQYSAIGDLVRAKATFERVIAIRTQTLGPTHPQVAAGLNNLANVHLDVGEYAEAKALQERALAIKEQRLGPDHPDVAASLMNLGLALHSLGRDEDARAMFVRALGIFEAKLGRDHPTVAQVLLDLALVDQTVDDLPKARAQLERALEIVEHAHGSSHPLVAQVLTNLGIVLNEMHEQAPARAQLVRAAKILEAELGLEHPHLGYPLNGLAAVALDDGRPADARVLAERALRLWARAGTPPEQQADARVMLARALVVLRNDRERAGVLVEQARAAYRAAKPARAKELARLEQWIERGLPPPGP